MRSKPPGFALTVVLAGLTAVVLAACGSTGSDSAGTTQAAGTAPAPTEAAASVPMKKYVEIARAARAKKK